MREIYTIGLKDLPANMARKKRQGNPTSDSSDSGDSNMASTVPTSACKHISRGVQLGTVKKKLKNGIRTSCDTCVKNPKTANLGLDAEEVIDDNWSYWLCLSCAHVGCGRGQYKHAIAHYNTPRSEPHDLVVDIDSWIVWCYPCEQKMALNSTKKLQECVEYIRRHLQVSGKPSAFPDPPSSSNSEISAKTSAIGPSTGKDDLGDGIKSTLVEERKKSLTKRQIKLSKVRGLMNLGNTCFYNSVLQCLSVTPYLTSVLERLIKSGETFSLPGAAESDKFEAPEVKGALGESGPLTSALLLLLLDMRNPGVHADTLRPQTLLKQLQNTFPQFRGNEQHDAHELLRHLLEGVRSDDLKRFQRVILEQHGLFGRKNDSVAADLKKRMKLYGHQLQDYILGVEGIFKGQLVSIVECQDCRHHSTRFESFLDLSLPVMEDKPLPPMRKKEQTEMFPGSSAPSKHQLKKQKKAARRNNKAQKNRRSEKMDGCVTILEESAKGSESEESDADVEDNADADASTTANHTEVVESGYSSEKQNTGESDGTSPSIVTGNGEGEQGGKCQSMETVKDEPNVSLSVSPDLPTAPVTASTSSASPLSGSQSQPRQADDWSAFHTPEHDCVEGACKYNCQARCFTPIDEELRITIPESGEGSIHISPVNPSERPVSRCDFFPSNHSGGLTDDFTPELETRLLSLCLDENRRTTHESAETNGFHEGTYTSLDKAANEPDIPSNRNSHSNNSNIGDNHDCMNLQNKENGKDSYIEAPQTASAVNSASAKIEGVSDDKDQVSGWCKTLAPRQQAEEGDCSIISCLNQFTSLELMTGNNKVGCDACTQRLNKDGGGKTVYTNSTKQFLISSPPPVLILHLKRFMMDNFRFKKLQRFVSFPLELDIAPFCSTKCQDSSTFEDNQTEVKYSLFGIVEHTGSLNAGHYVAYIKIRSSLEENDPRWSYLPSSRKFVYPKDELGTNGCEKVSDDIEEKWYSVSDSRVVEIAEAKVLKIQAYLLFYERIM